MTLTTQFLTIISMIAGGIYLGAAVGTFRRFSRIWKKRLVFSFSIEICFWLLQTLILFYILYLVNQGELRFYILLAILCGFAMYKSLLERVYLLFLEKVISAVISIYRFFYRLVQAVIVKPILGLIRLTIALLLWIWGIVLWIGWLAIKIIWYPFSLIFRLIWRLMPQNAKKYFTHLAGFYSKIKNKINKWWKFLREKRG
ncbi:spore cortex biosynthesis protein YabQ [Aquibacillus albus]|uniref:Spore cortex biosynthesis protein YabQ n=1 Tax=Aquibacillus albus TaxID=1168171 RepID=A0ABS2N4V4_9BACI|nr:spore cortex biosynthesis protein YabQ [Aquibacillus albus]MBM7573162.1 spore cortex biosynthesis protein YabQ [Aquibacillus albus]